MRAVLFAIPFAMLALGPPSAAAAPPSAYADARLGSLSVTSGILVSRSGVDLRGVWIDESLPCSAFRRLRVSVEVFWSRPSGASRRVSRFKTGLVGNCAEGGPNFGYTLGARGLGLACSNGRWRPGTYSFAVVTRHLARGLRASASLGWDGPGSC